MIIGMMAGSFSMRVVIHKVVDDQLWRFTAMSAPYASQQFVDVASGA